MSIFRVDSVDGECQIRGRENDELGMKELVRQARVPRNFRLRICLGSQVSLNEQ